MLETCIANLQIFQDGYDLSPQDTYRLQMTIKALNFCRFLDTEGIHFERCVRHPEPEGCADYHRFDYCLEQNYAVPKHLLLQERKGEQKKYLVVTNSCKQVDLNALRVNLSCRKLEFVQSEDMEHLIQATPGSVSIFHMIYDQERVVHLIIDEDLLAASELAFHPLYNGMSVFMRPKECFKFLNFIGRSVTVMPIPAKESNKVFHK